jgi:hypothetical protein
MGLDYIDEWTFVHFISGFLFTSTLTPSYPLLSVIITNTGHGISELWSENDHNGDTGEHIENLANHYSDMVAFFLGSLIGYFYGCQYYNKNENATTRWVILIIMILLSINEFMRELLPRTWVFSPAFKPFTIFGYDLKDYIMKGN